MLEEFCKQCAREPTCYLRPYIANQLSNQVSSLTYPVVLRPPGLYLEKFRVEGRV